MSDYGTMQSRIADELGRADLTDQIKKAIQSAIKKYERQRFYFNTTTATFSTVPGQEYYGASDLADIPNIVQFDAVEIDLDGVSRPLSQRDVAFTNDINSIAGFMADPEYFTYYQQQIRLAPVPSLARTVKLSYVYRLPALSENEDTNAWMTDAEELIRMRAKCDLFVNVIRDVSAQEIALCREYERDALADLLRETALRMSSGKLRTETELTARSGFLIVRGY